jgi:hypothetical protein
MCIGHHVKYPLFLSDFNGTLISGQIFETNIRTSNFVKIHPVGAELFHAECLTDGRTGRHDEANRRFLQFCERT